MQRKHGLPAAVVQALAESFGKMPAQPMPSRVPGAFGRSTKKGPKRKSTTEVDRRARNARAMRATVERAERSAARPVEKWSNPSYGPNNPHGAP